MPTHIPIQPPVLAARSVADVLAMADALERAAVAQYAKFGQLMRQVGHDDVAAVFEALAAEEQQHVESVQRLAKSVSDAPINIDAKGLALPATLGAEEIGSPALLTPYKALSIAVVAEEKAFTLWTYVASAATSDAVRLQAEVMARQELVHAAKLRHARRRAYHADPAHSSDRRLAALGADIDLPAMRAAAARLAREAVDFLSEAARQLESRSDSESAELLRQAAGDLQADRAPDAPAGVASADPHLILRRIEQSAAAGRAGILFDAAGRLEQLLESYLQLLELSTDSRMTGKVQDLGDRVARNVARVNARLYAVEPSLAGIADDGGVKPAAISA